MSDPIEGFWSFWAENRGAIERAIAGGTLMEWVEAIGSRVKAIDPELDWELGRGHVSQHYLCVSAKGDPVRRVVAERWRAAGPAADAVFEYHAARPGGGLPPAGQEIAFGEHPFAAEDFRFALEIDEARRRIHLVAWHPTFARVDRQLAGTAAFIWLDTVFGEDDVERWIGALDLADAEPPDAVGFRELFEAVAALAQLPPAFTILKGELADGRPLFAIVDLGVKRVDHLLMDLHVEVALALRDPTDDGLPTKPEADRLNEAEDALIAALGHDAVYLGRETGGDERVLHFHAANGGPVETRVDEWAEAQPWDVEVRARLDPTWDVLQRW